MLRRKHDSKDLRKYYFIFFQVGLIFALLITLGAFKFDMSGEDKSSNNEKEEDDQEIVQVKDVVRTKQVDKPPTPPSPQPPKEVPNDEIIEAEAQDALDQIDQQMSSGKKMAMPEPPEQEEEEKVFKVVEQQPELIGGLDSLRSMIKYPSMAEKAGIEGRVYIQFIVNKKGKVENPEVVRGPGAGLNKEALRVIKKASFRPGIQQGHPVNVRYTMPIIFSLGN
jgi:protein TonB